MCGIIGIIGKAPVTPLLLEALKRLEYRGYDSAGVATLVNGHIDRRRAEGKLVNLEALAAKQPLPGTIGIGHTRWATHGKPSERNAHPIATDRVAVVHNGIIENFQELKDELLAEGRRFDTDTDTEVVAQLLTSHLERQMSPEKSMAEAVARLKGAFSLVVMFAGRHDVLMGARRGSSLAVGHGDGEMYIGTDAMALAPFTKRISYLEEGDWVIVRQSSCTFHNNGQEVERQVRKSRLNGSMTGKGNFDHHMRKEIGEQPSVVGDMLQAYLDTTTRRVRLPKTQVDWLNVSQVKFVACGTAYHTGLIAAGWFERIAGIPASAEVASEFRYRGALMPAHGVTVAISQSGETADTKAALEYARSKKQAVLAVVNVPESEIARLADTALMTLAGPEIGVASTKATTNQLVMLLALAIEAGRARGTLTRAQEDALTAELIELPAKLSEVISEEDTYRRHAHALKDADTALYIGRGPSFPVALEGALKLKEISYIHAEGYAAGEMKHGPMALITDKVPVIVVAPSDAVFAKTLSNLQEARARDGKMFLVTDARGAEQMRKQSDGNPVECIVLPAIHEELTPMLCVVAMQLLAYYTALAKGTDIDQPRNLAKSVTVE